jgi:hypothetical protein
MGVMGARRLWLVAPVAVCVFLCVLVFGGGSAFAAGSNPFGEQGEGAGQLNRPLGLGLDQETGDLYVPEFDNERVSKFDGSGGFLFAWGWAVDAGNLINGLQTCTVASGCRKGNGGAGSGQFAGSCGAQAVAVDNNPLGSYQHDVYVVDFCNSRVQKFDSSGKFLLMFGGHVNETQDNNPSATEAQRDVCVAGEACTRGTSGTGNGEFELSFDAADIAMGPEARVYVGDENRIEVFEPTGAWRENVPLPAALTSGGGKVTALAVDSAGDSFVKVEGVPGVHELDPTGTELAVKFDESSEAIEALTRDASTGNLFVVDSTGSLHVLEYGSSGKEVASLASKTAVSSRGIVYSEALHELYVAGSDSWNIWRVGVPPPGPLVEPGSEVATAGVRGAAALQATIDPEGNDTSYRFEYVDDTKFVTSGFAGASSTPVTGVGASSEDFEDHQVEAALPAKTLVAGTTYHWRVVATDTVGHTVLGASESFEEIPAARVEGPWAANVTSTSATLAALVDPLSSNTSYRLEVTGPGYEHVFTGSVGEGMGYVTVGPLHIQGLLTQSIYHYELITTSDVGTIESTGRTFTTQVGGSELVLPDGRAWELVSPADKKGALIQPDVGLNDFGIVKASIGGGGIAYEASDTIGEGAAGKTNMTPLISTRTADGWRTMDVSMPGSLSSEDEGPGGGGPEVDKWLSSDLSLMGTEPPSQALPLSREATEYTPYLRHNLTCSVQPEECYTPLVTASNVEPPGTHFGGESEKPTSLISLVGGSPDLNHLILYSPTKLKEDGGVGLYEWSDGELQYVGSGNLGSYINGSHNLLSAHSVSNDGRWIVFSKAKLESGFELVVRDMVKKKTIRVGGVAADFQTVSGDGSRLFYREHGELYVLNPETGAQTDVTVDHGAGEASAGVQDAVLGIGDDGSYVYFVATGVLSGGAKVGGYNLYVAHDESNVWVTTFVATLSGEDEKSWFAPESTALPPHCDCGGVNRTQVTSQVSSSGRFVSFMSDGSLTGYDNVDAVSGHPDEEVYLYDAVANRLVCVSCNPTGARPVGVFDGPDGLLVDPGSAWGGLGGSSGKHWIAAMTPSWYEVYEPQPGAVTESYQPHFVSDGGRVFFDSPDGLVPQATNGLMNVYEYEPTGVGDCSASSSSFSERSDGCVSLLSAGTSSSESAFYDSSEAGNDAFFITTNRLVASDYDTAYDVYDARVCSASEPCPPVTASPPPCTSGDSCKAAPTPQPEIFGPAPSATFSGTGNVTPASSKAIVRRRSLSMAQKLARTLRACRKEKGGRKTRTVCERRARKRYAVRKANATSKRGHR